MSKFEWMELETLSSDIVHTQTRLDAARATKNLGLVQLLERELADALKRRAQVLADITKGLGDLPPEKWTPGYAVFRSACSGVMYPMAEWIRRRL
jgi:hypothetical protein